MRFDRRQKVQGAQRIKCSKGRKLVECVTFGCGWRHQGGVQKRARNRQQIATLALCTEQRGLWGEQITEICVLELAAFPLPTANWCDLLGGGHRGVLVKDTKWQWPIKLQYNSKWNNFIQCTCKGNEISLNRRGFSIFGLLLSSPLLKSQSVDRWQRPQLRVSFEEMFFRQSECSSLKFSLIVIVNAQVSNVI